MRVVIFSYFLLFILFASFSHANIIINEVMYHPIQDDNYNEWIEIYNPTNSTVNMENWTLCDVALLKGFVNKSDNNTYLNTTFEIQANKFALITDGGTGTEVYQNFNVSGNAIALHVDAGTLCGRLTNTGKYIAIKNSTMDVADSVDYSPSWGGDGNGNTTCVFNSTFQECMPTPGYANALYVNETIATDVILSINLQNTTIVNTTYTSLFKIEIINKTNCSIADNITVYYNITNSMVLIKNDTFVKSVGCSATSNTGEWTPDIIDNFALCGIISNATINNTNTANDIACKNITVIDSTTISCDLSLEITTSKLIYENETVKYNLVVNDLLCNISEHPINITYWAEDLFGNIIKDYVTIPGSTTPCDENISMRWTPNDIFGSEGYTIKANITNPGCNDVDYTNNFYSKTILFKGFEHPKESYIKINDINSGKVAKFAETVDIKTEIYKNSTNKYAIYAWVEDSGGTKLSETTTIHIRSKNTLYNFTLPIQLKHNCEGNYADGNHIVVVEGLGLNTTGNLTISGNANDVCYTEYISSGSGGGSCSCPTCEEQTCPVKAPDYEILAYKDEVKVNEEFETKIKLETDSHKNISVYSYVFDGNKILSDGFDGTKWAGTWTANKQEIELNNSIILVLKNKIKRGTSTGTYTLRVRIDDGKKYDMDREINVVEEEGGATSTITAATGEEETFVNKTEKEEEIITGYAIREKEEKEFKPSPTMMTMYMIYIKLLASKAQETQQTQEVQEDKLINNNQTNATDYE